MSGSTLPSPRARGRFLLGGAVGVLLIGSLVALRPRAPLLPVIMPSNPASLDPQVRAYIEGMTSTVRNDPGNPGKRATLGLVYAANGLWSEARQTFLDVVRLNPDEPLAPLYAAVALQERSDDAGALREFRSVTERFPNFAPGWYRVGEASLRLGDLAGAEAAFTRLIHLAPGEWRGPAGLGEVRLRKGEAPAAIPLLEQAVHRDRSARPAQFLLGQAYRATGRTNEARMALALGSGEARQPMPDRWSNEAPQHMRSLPDQIAQADELSARGRPDLAVGLLQRALPFHPNHAGLLNQLAIVFNRAGRPEQALPLLDRVLKADPDAAAARITRAFAQVQLGHPDLGLADALAVSRLAPQMVQAHLAVANALLAQEQDSRALAALAEALKYDPMNAEIHVEMGDVLWRNLGDKGAALNHFQQAVELGPALAKAYSHLGLLQLDIQQAAAARKTLETLRTAAPGSAELEELEAALQKP